MAVELIHRLGGGLSYMIVSEAGASVYSGSCVGRDLTGSCFRLTSLFVI